MKDFMIHSSLQKYAQILLNIGVSLQKGQNLQIKGEPVHWPFMQILAEEAYKMGARYVRVSAEHPMMTKIRAEHVPGDHLGYVPAFTERDLQMMLDEKWALIHLGGMEDPHIYDDLPRERHAQIMQAYNLATQSYRTKIVEGGCPWTVADLPTEKWAAQVFGGDASPEEQDRLWNALEKILKLDRDDPVQAWIDQSETLQTRAEFLNDKQFDAVHFRGEGTDLRIGLIPNSSWQGGVMQGSHGKDFLPNIPTYEVFITPDFRKTEGTVQVTRPVMVLGSEVAGAKFTFKNGEVVDFDAEKGRENLEQFFKIDPKSRKLGEVALVDCDLSLIHI